jgi:hypothetical protein
VNVSTLAVIAIVAIAILGACVFALVVALGFSLIRHHEAEMAWADERRELLTRIQRPEYVPAAPMPNFELPEMEPDQVELINTIADLSDLSEATE